MTKKNANALLMIAAGIVLTLVVLGSIGIAARKSAAQNRQIYYRRRAN